MRFFKNLVSSVFAVFCLLTSAVASPVLSHPAPSVSEGLKQMLPMFLIFIVVLYFMTIRPQNKKAQEKKKLMDSLSVGDEVMTIGGIVATISTLTDTHAILSLSTDNKLTLQRSSISAVLPKGTLSSIK